MQNQENQPDSSSKTTEQEPKGSSSHSLGEVLGFQEKQVNYTCGKHGASTVTVYNLGRGWMDAYCPTCKQELLDEREAAETIRALEQASQRQRRYFEALVEGAAIPPRFQDRSFENHHPPTEAAKKIHTICKQYAEEFPTNRKLGRGLIFCGNAGTGKSHLACAIANFIIREHKLSAVFMKVAKAIRTVKDTYRSSADKTEQEAINWFKLPDLLILDEVGVQFGTEAEKYILFEIINERYEQLKPTLLLSNLALEALTQYTGERVIDRMKENGGRLLVFDWKSHRGKEIV